MLHKIKTVKLYRRSSLLVVAAVFAAGCYVAVAHAMPKPVDASASPVTARTSSNPKPFISSQAQASASPTPTPKTQTASTTAQKPKAVVASAVPRGKALYVSSEQAAAITNAANTVSNDSDAAVLSRLASKPTAKWFGGWSGDIRNAVSGYVASAAASGSVPVMVAYNIPGRDCGGESAGGVSSASAYASWIQGFASGVAGRQSIVILEPDATAADCFTPERAAMLSKAVQVLQASGASVYLDAGNPTWRTVSDMASRLKQAGIESASGFSLNVSNFQTTSSNISFGSSLSAQLGGKHFVIDTSRNGNGPSSGNEWCNPAGRALGKEPTTSTGYALVDAFLWVKVPGESDGNCGSSVTGTQAPSAGSYWAQYALMLARNAGW